MLENYAKKKRDNKVALKSLKKAMRRYGSPTRLLQIGYNYIARQLTSLVVQIRKLHSDG